MARARATGRYRAEHDLGLAAAEHDRVAVGMQHEGRLKQYVHKWDVFEDVECCSILRRDFQR